LAERSVQKRNDTVAFHIRPRYNPWRRVLVGMPPVGSFTVTLKFAAAGALAALAIVFTPASQASAHGYNHHGHGGLIFGLAALGTAAVVGAAAIVTAPIRVLAAPAYAPPPAYVPPAYAPPPGYYAPPPGYYAAPAPGYYAPAPGYYYGR
jgi:hypothetical protein